MEILWHAGFLQAETSPAARRRQASADAFAGPHQANQHAVIAGRRFWIHPMFWAYLGAQATTPR